MRITLEDIPLDLLMAHPENGNLVGAETLRKQRRHVELTGRYEPLIVRLQPRGNSRAAHPKS